MAGLVTATMQTSPAAQRSAAHATDALCQDVERARIALEAEHAANAALRSELHDAGQRIAASDAARHREADALAALQRDRVTAQHNAAAAWATHQGELQAAKAEMA